MVGANGNVHANEARKAGKHGTENEAERHQTGKSPREQNGDDDAHDGDRPVLTLQIGLRAFLNGAGDLLHLFRAGGGSEYAFRGRIRVVEGKKPAGQYHDE